MSSLFLVVTLAAGLMLMAAALVWLVGRRIERQNRVIRRFDEKFERRIPNAPKHYHFKFIQWIYRILQRGGLARRPIYAVSSVVLLLLAGGIGFRLDGGVGLCLGLLLFAAGSYLFVLWRAAATHEMLLNQLPGFIDHIIRIMAVGRSFESALLQAIADSPAPLSEALEGVVIENALGGDLVVALQDAADIYRMQELQLITLSLKINQRYGGSIRAMLENIITLIRQRERADRELKALTGETRLSAWMLGLMPVTMAGYMMITNPTYIGYLLKDPNGPQIIYTALGLQVTGGLILWRLMRSIR